MPDPKTFGESPNVSGKSLRCAFDNASNLNGCLSVEVNTDLYGGGVGDTKNKKDLSFDASKCSSIYGATTKVQPKAFNLLMIIKN